ncbi:MAG TPA: phosphomannomutase/phosphoglucomutase [Patescibacteria group bacterium]|nr:phosphomannomutase/phosphoglucomutase [Patescibacteria group bacterium]
MNFTKTIFKAYDIRGLVQGELSKELAYQIGRSFPVLLQEKGTDSTNKKLVVGYDMRASSQEYYPEVIRGLNDAGISVVNIGLSSTPLFNFACAHYPEHAGGIMVTASHNPAEYNGFKLTLGDGLPIGKNNGMSRLAELVNMTYVVSGGGQAKTEEKNVLKDYMDRVLGLVPRSSLKPLKIVVDAGNGMAKVTLPEILKQLPVEVEYLYLEPDGNFPNHEANPLKVETLKDLQAKVLETKADFGFALDGDADRVGLVDNQGQVVPASFVGGLVGLEVLRSKPGSTLLYDLRMSRAVKEIWEKNGGQTQMCPVGHANIKAFMKERKAVFAAELSLHLYYGDMYDVESSDLSLLYILKILSESNKKLSELWPVMNTKFHSGEINFEVEDKEIILQKLKTKYSDAVISDLDGLTFTYPNFWFNVRGSNTEPLLRLNLEADDEATMQEKIKEVKKIIQ